MCCFFIMFFQNSHNGPDLGLRCVVKINQKSFFLFHLLRFQSTSKHKYISIIILSVHTQTELTHFARLPRQKPCSINYAKGDKDIHSHNNKAHVYGETDFTVLLLKIILGTYLFPISNVYILFIYLVCVGFCSLS